MFTQRIKMPLFTSRAWQTHLTIAVNLVGHAEDTKGHIVHNFEAITGLADVCGRKICTQKTKSNTVQECESATM